MILTRCESQPLATRGHQLLADLQVLNDKLSKRLGEADAKVANAQLVLPRSFCAIRWLLAELLRELQRQPSDQTPSLRWRSWRNSSRDCMVISNGRCA